MGKNARSNKSAPVPNGALVIIGGAEDRDKDQDKRQARHLEILSGFLKLIKARHPVIEVVTSASADEPEKTFEDYKNSFESICQCTVNHIYHAARDHVNIEEIRDRLNAADAVFMSGGDQLRLTSIYGGTEFLQILKDRYIFDRLVVGGTSAGAMALSTPMIYAGVGRDELIAGNVKATMGMEFLKDVCIDTHFVDRGRFVRMAQVIATNPSSIGIGIEENTALVVTGGLNAEILGFGVVIIIDARKSLNSNVVEFDDEIPISIRGLQVNILGKGDKYTIPQMNEPHH